MPDRPKLNSANTFCWIELACKDMPTAKEFYGSLMGWKFRDDRTPEGGVYSSIKLGDKGLVGGLYEFALPEEPKKKKQPKVPAFWGSYVATKNITSTTKKAHDLGATIIADTMPIGDSGRMSVIQDPAGALFGIWEPKKLEGFGPDRDTLGASGWNELLTLDEDLSVGFYTKLFNWKAKKKKVSAKLSYTYFMMDEKRVAGMMELNPDLGDLPPHWLVYFNVKNCDKSTHLAMEKGAKILFPPTSFPNVGRMSVVMDGEGASFALIQYEPAE